MTVCLILWDCMLANESVSATVLAADTMIWLQRKNAKKSIVEVDRFNIIYYDIMWNDPFDIELFKKITHLSYFYDFIIW